MKPFTAIVSVLLAFTIASSHAASLNRVRRQVVPREFANINIENYLKNDRAVAFQLKCIVYDGPCDRIGKYLKVTIPELLTNQCQGCDPAQRQRAGRLVQHIQQRYPKEWSDAVQKFQGGQVKKEDADRLESLLGVKLDSKLVAAAPVAPVEVSSTTTAAPAESSTTAAPAVSSTAAAPVVPVAGVSSTSAPEVSSTATPVTSSVAPEVSSSAAPPAAPTSAVPLASSSVAPVAASSETPVSSSAAPEVSSSTVVALASSSEAPAVPAAPASSAAPVVSSSPSSNVASSSAAPVTA